MQGLVALVLFLAFVHALIYLHQMILVDLYQQPFTIFEVCAAISELSYVFALSFIFRKKTRAILYLVSADQSDFNGCSKTKRIALFYALPVVLIGIGIAETWIYVQGYVKIFSSQKKNYSAKITNYFLFQKIFHQSKTHIM